MQSTMRAISVFLPLTLLLISAGCGRLDGGAVTRKPADAPVNQAPRFLAEPTSMAFANVDEDFAFEPAASDPDHDALQFTAVNLPAWAHLDSKTGRISGRPGTTHIGSYESIAITVSDREHQVTSRGFSIEVTGPGSGVANLDWPAPVSKVDGSLLDDLAGFRILYGRDPEALDHSVWINDPNAHSYSFATLAEGTWYFSIVSVNSAGLEGPRTMTARKTI